MSSHVVFGSFVSGHVIFVLAATFFNSASVKKVRAFFFSFLCGFAAVLLPLEVNDLMPRFDPTISSFSRLERSQFEYECDHHTVFTRIVCDYVVGTTYSPAEVAVPRKTGEDDLCVRSLFLGYDYQLVQ